MKRNLFLVISVLTLCSSLQAEESRLSFGLRGGASIYDPRSNMEGQIGPMGMFDFGYTCLWDPTPFMKLGLHVGLSAGYAQNALSGKVKQSFTALDYAGNELLYTLTATNVTDKYQQVQLEVPLQLALVADNFFANVGLKVMSPIAWNKFQQTISNDLVIQACYTDEAISFDPPTVGSVTSEQLSQSGKSATPLLTLAVAMDLGGEWTINEKHHIGLGIYADFGFWNYNVNNSTSEQLITIIPASTAEGKAEVSVNTMHSVQMGAVNYYDCGVKVYYAFNVNDKEAETKEPDLAEKPVEETEEEAEETVQERREARRIAKEAERARKAELKEQKREERMIKKMQQDPADVFSSYR